MLTAAVAACLGGLPAVAAAGAAADPSVLAFGAAPPLGGPAPASLRAPLAGMAATPSGGGYWLAAADGGVFAVGDAAFLGSTGALPLRRPVVGMAAGPAAAERAGYWLVASDGGVFAFGAAAFLGSTGAVALNRPIVGMASTPSGGGYWLVASDGGVFAFGDAAFLGSTGGLRLSRPITAVAATASGLGYWLAAADGGVFAFGDAAFHGAGTGRLPAGTQVVGMARAAAGGYWIAAGRPPLAQGAVGPGVENLQRRLAALGYWGPVDGRFASLTVQQVYAFQKANGLPRDGQLDGEELGLLERAGRPVPRSTTGLVVEIDKARQLLIVARDGWAEWVFNTSTGNNRRYAPGAVAVTPEGRFRVERQIDALRISPLGVLWRPKYFVGGYAIHGSPSVPPFPASHGCVRLSNAAINFVWAENVVPVGTDVWVYS